MEEFYLGIDPSTVSTGYAVVNSKGELVDYGVIKPTSSLEAHKKLHYQYTKIEDIMKNYQIKSIFSEEQFGGANMDTLKKLCQVTGVVMLMAAQYGVGFEIKYPASWRKMFHGNGAVKKADTLLLVNEMFGLELKKSQNDISDAVGLAMCAYKTGENLL